MIHLHCIRFFAFFLTRSLTIIPHNFTISCPTTTTAAATAAWWSITCSRLLLIIILTTVRPRTCTVFRISLFSTNIQPVTKNIFLFTRLRPMGLRSLRSRVVPFVPLPTKVSSVTRQFFVVISVAFPLGSGGILATTIIPSTTATTTSSPSTATPWLTRFIGCLIATLRPPVSLSRSFLLHAII